MWEREPSLGEHILNAWEGESMKGDLGVISKALKNTLVSLKQWSNEHFGSARKELERLRAQLADLHALNADSNATNDQPIRSAYQPPASSTFLSEQTSHQQSVSSTFLSEQISTSHLPPAKRTGWMLFEI
jgi:hypothetical protein